MSYPIKRPISGVYSDKGKLAVVGSYNMFTDDYFDKEENSKLFDFFMKFLLTDEVCFEKNATDNII